MVEECLLGGVALLALRWASDGAVHSLDGWSDAWRSVVPWVYWRVVDLVFDWRYQISKEASGNHIAVSFVGMDGDSSEQQSQC